MMTSMQRTIISTSPAQTEALGSELAMKLKGGEVIELISDLGGGKTTFTRGLASGIGTVDPVASPTFTISREYSGGRLHIYHFDFYRLGEAGVIADELHEVVGDDNAVVIVEWAEVVHHVLPEDRITLRIIATDESTREIEIKVPESLGYVLEDIA